MYDTENAIKNENDCTSQEIGEDYGIDDVLIGSGTSKGIVFLIEELYEKDN